MTGPRPWSTIHVRPMTGGDWLAVRDIYVEGIRTGVATFATTPPSWPEWDADHLTEHRWVAEEDGQLLAWVACGPTSSRCVYAGVVEVSIYVGAAARGRGVGSRLLGTVIASTEEAGIWTLQSGIFPHNLASLALHDRHGFRVVGTRERLGRMGDTWLDVVLLERRSAVVGV